MLCAGLVEPAEEGRLPATTESGGLCGAFRRRAAHGVIDA